MVCYPFPPNASAGAVRSERVARHLATKGWDVEVVTIRQRSDLYGDTALLDGLPNNVRVHFTRGFDPWLWLRGRQVRRQLWRRVKGVLMEVTAFPDHTLYWNAVAIAKGLEIHRKRPVDLLYTTSPPHATQLCGLVLHDLIRRPWVADFRDPWTQNACRRAEHPLRVVRRLERVMETSVLRRADIVLANTTANRDNLLKEFPFLSRERVLYLPNGWEAFPDHMALRENLPEFTIVHSGNFYPQFKPYALLHALALWRSEKKGEASRPPFRGRLRVVILGTRDTETEKLVNALALTDIVEIRPWVALEEARRIMTRADLLWATLGTGPESGSFIPSKLFEYIAARRPIMGFFPEGEAATLIRRTNTGTVFTCDDPLPIVRFLSDCLLRHDRGQPLDYRPSEADLSSLKVESLISHLASIMATLVRVHHR